ncbi:ArsR family transcriptional regulator [Arthrobacter alpinus]|uniref:ArsR family transcriptional regulator n=1 Tax=Arthrobacter alpinus TaxID=656366 RepID=A0A0S2LYI1_9MICC|nr:MULTISPECIES: metalloregulator ArsR/SmtB family transcription factor [Arthrobacter]ALO66514.1 ArsR family transcriptional regulator [Arthrobacter alpinus]
MSTTLVTDIPAVLGTQADAPCCVSAPAAGALEAEEAAALAARFKALADPNRLRILSMIAADPAAETCVCDITEPLDLGQPTVSHHLKILVEAGLLTRDKRGVWAYYSLVPGALESLAATLTPKV